MEALRKTLVREARVRRDRSAGQQLAVLDAVAGTLREAGRAVSPLNVALAAAETLGAGRASAGEAEGLLLLLAVGLSEAGAAAVQRCLEPLELAVERGGGGSAAAFQALERLFAAAPRTHLEEAGPRARVLGCCEAAVAAPLPAVRQAAAAAAGAAARGGGPALRRSLGEWLRAQLAHAGPGSSGGGRRRDAAAGASAAAAGEERAAAAARLLAGALAPVLTPALTDAALAAAAAAGRPALAAAAFRVAATAAAAGRGGPGLAARLGALAPPADSAEARNAWTAAVGAALAVAAAAAGPGGGRPGAEEEVLAALERLAGQLGEARLAAETGAALAGAAAALAARGPAWDGRLGALAAAAWGWPLRAGWKRGAARLVAALTAAGIAGDRGVVWGPLLERLEVGAWFALSVCSSFLCKAAWQAAPEERGLLEQTLGLLAQALGGRRFAALLPLRLGAADARLHLLPVLARHLQGTELAFFGALLPALPAAPAALAVLPALCVLPSDFAALWRPRVAPLLAAWLASPQPALRRAAALSLLRAAVSLRQAAAQEPGPLRLAALLHRPDPAAAAADLEVLRASAPPLLEALLACHLAHGERGALEAAGCLASLLRGAALPAALFRAALGRWLAAGDARALAVCEALLPGVEGAAATRLAAAAAPGLARGQKQSYRCAVALCRAGLGRLLPTAPLGPWQDLEAGAARFRLELRRCQLEAGVAADAGGVAVREALLGWRDCGPKARAQAELLLEAAARAAPDATGRQLAAALALPDPAVLAVAVAMLAHLLRSEELREAPSDPDAFWDGVCGAVLALSRSASRELQTSALAFWMAAAKAHLVDQAPKAQALLAALWSWDEAARTHHRREMKVLVERLMKRAGPNAVREGLRGSEEGLRLVAALAKKKRRKKKEYEEGKLHKKEAKQKKRERFLDPDVDDLLSTATSVSSSKPKATPGWDDFEVDQETGKPLVLDPEDEQEMQREKGGFIGDGDDFVPDDDEQESGDMNLDGEDEADGDEPKKAKGSKSKSKKQQADQGGKKVLGGKMYKAKRAEGDLKRGKFDPFTYVRLDPKNLNKRRVGHTAEQFSEMFQRKRPGVKKGHKHVGKKAGGRYYSK